MNRAHFVRRAASVVAATTCSLVVFAFCAPSAFAMILRVPQSGTSAAGSPHQVPMVVHTVVTGGMAGWQIALIATAAAVLTATLAVFTDRARASHRQVSAA
jgi:predicted ribosomally synthesized peptide with SipW-like signal peptide